MTERAWCPTCGARQPVVEFDTGSRMTGRGEVEWPITRLDCGHVVDGQDRIVGPAPGAPYAGVGGFHSYRAFVRRWLYGGETEV
jgi:hypothetical protein